MIRLLSPGCKDWQLDPCVCGCITAFEMDHLIHLIDKNEPQKQVTTVTIQANDSLTITEDTTSIEICLN